MISFEAARQALAVPVPGLSGYLMVRHGLRGWCGGVPGWPHGLDRCQITRAAPGVTGARSARAATPQAPLTPECGPPGHSGSQGMGFPLPARGAGGAGRGGVPRRGGGCCRHCHSHIRGSGPQVCLRQDGAPDLNRESPWSHIIYGDRSCHGERPGTPPARAGHEGRGSGGGHLGPDEPGQLAGDRHGGLRRGLAAGVHQVHVPGVQPPLPPLICRELTLARTAI